jgi:ubiquinone/menaquinone biosynthesis C-methylase UbiE
MNEIDLSRPAPVAHLDQVAASTPGRAYKQLVLDLLDLTPGQTVLDLGCGPGTDLAPMAAEDGSVHRARTDRVLQHVDDPSRVLAEFRRVACAGGRIVMAEPDWDGLLIDTPDLAVSRGLTRFITTEIVRNATIGRGLARLCADAGLSVRSVTPVAPVFRDFETADQILALRRNVTRAITAGYLNSDARQWIEEAGSQPFMASALLFVVVAEAPS